MEGFLKDTKTKKFTWQPHGSQFTIREQVPEKTLVMKLKKPENLDKVEILKAIGFDNSWVIIQK